MSSLAISCSTLYPNGALPDFNGFAVCHHGCLRAISVRKLLQKLSNHFLKEHLQNKYVLWQPNLQEQVIWDYPMCGFSGVVFLPFDGPTDLGFPLLSVHPFPKNVPDHNSLGSITPLNYQSHLGWWDRG